MAENGVNNLRSPEKTSMYGARHPAHHSFQRYRSFIIDLSIILESIIDKEVCKQLQHTLYDVTHSRAWTEFEIASLSHSAFHLWLQDHLASSKNELLGAVNEILFKGRILRSDFIELINRSAQRVNVHILGNLPLPIWFALRPALAILDPTLQFHISSELSCRLPYPTIFEHFKRTSGATSEDLSNCLFITGSVDAHISARATGLSTLLVNSRQPLLNHVSPFLREPLPAAKAWLQLRAGLLNLKTSISTETIRDTYIQLLILELTNNETLLYPELLDPNASTTKFSWFVGPRPADIWDFPPDLDCTSLAFLYLPRLISVRGLKDANDIMDEILRYQVEETGLLNTYLDHDKIRLDLIALANTMSLFYAYGRGNNLRATEEFLLSVLRTGAYEEGSHYYTNPDVFLFALSRLLVLRPLPLASTISSNGWEQTHGPEVNGVTKIEQDSVISGLEHIKSTFYQALRHRIYTHIDRETDALGLSCRIIAGARCGIRLDASLDKLLALQQEDGSWPACVIYKFNRRDGVCWHQGLTVALAVNAIEEWDLLRSRTRE